MVSVGLVGVLVGLMQVSRILWFFLLNHNQESLGLNGFFTWTLPPTSSLMPQTSLLLSLPHPASLSHSRCAIPLFPPNPPCPSSPLSPQRPFPFSFFPHFILPLPHISLLPPSPPPSSLFIHSLPFLFPSVTPVFPLAPFSSF